MTEEIKLPSNLPRNPNPPEERPTTSPITSEPTTVGGGGPNPIEEQKQFFRDPPSVGGGGPNPIEEQKQFFRDPPTPDGGPLELKTSDRKPLDNKFVPIQLDAEEILQMNSNPLETTGIPNALEINSADLPQLDQDMNTDFDEEADRVFRSARTEDFEASLTSLDDKAPKADKKSPIINIDVSALTGDTTKLAKTVTESKKLERFIKKASLPSLVDAKNRLDQLLESNTDEKDDIRHYKLNLLNALADEISSRSLSEF